MSERSTSLFNFPTIEDVHRWKTQFESLSAEETEMKARHDSPLKKASLTGFHATAKHIAAKAVSPSSETMRTI